MGHGNSKPATDAVVNIMAQTVASSQASCLASAVNHYALNIDGARNVVLDKVRIQMQAQASSTCEFVTVVDMDGLRAQLDAAVARAMPDASSADRTTITSSVSETLVQSCLSNAYNELTKTFTNPGGNVTLDGTRVSQTATANVAQCLLKQSLADGTSLTDFIASVPSRVLDADGNPIQCSNRLNVLLYLLAALLFGFMAAMALLVFLRRRMN
jgi:hypothetical protein